MDTSVTDAQTNREINGTVIASNSGAKNRIILHDQSHGAVKNSSQLYPGTITSVS